MTLTEKGRQHTRPVWRAQRNKKSEVVPMDDNRIFDDDEVVDFLLCEETLQEKRSRPPEKPQGGCLVLFVLFAPAGLALWRFLA